MALARRFRPGLTSWVKLYRSIMRVLIALVAAVLLLAPVGVRAARPTSREEVRFGIAVARKGLWAEARFRFERALTLDPDNVAALNNLAVACESQGDFDRAREAYEKALSLEPKNSHIQQNYELFREGDDKRKRSAEREKREATR